MQFNDHSELSGRHAFLSASKYHWINYDNEKFDRVYHNHRAALEGSQLHDLAFNLIRLGVKLPRTSATLNLYVNDAIGFRMKPEQILFYSDNAFGTTDAISFRNNVLRIHDLKTGESVTSFQQLLVYAAFFCLEYGYSPHKIKTELRIYQQDEVKILEADPEEVRYIADKVIEFDKRIEAIKSEKLA